MSPEELRIIIGVLFVLVALLVVWIARLEFRIKKLTTGTNKENLETGLARAHKHADDFEEFKKRTIAHVGDIEKRLGRSVQKMATVRFDAFRDGSSGGGQSFATAFLDSHGDGVVISTLHSRERVGVFSKPIKNGTSSYELTPEESEAIKQAKA